jgi:hypothetical protein
LKLKHYLIASEQNDYKPWILTPMALGVFCLVIWGIRLLAPATITLAQSTIDAQDLMNRINDQRSQRFIPTLNTNSKLISAASGKADDMLKRSYFSHVDPDGNYVWGRIEAAGYAPYLTLGENLAMDFNSASDVVDAWMNSPTHRSNIVNPKFQDQGLASVAGLFEPNHNSIIVVSLFGALMATKSSNASALINPPPPPAATPVIQNPPAGQSNLKISNDVKISTTTLSGSTIVDLDVIITGNPTLVTAALKTQSITLLAGKVAGEYVGKFTFDSTEDLSKQTITLQARDKNNARATLSYPISIEPAIAGPSSVNTAIPVSNETQIINILRIVFGVFATIYMAFLAIDAIIIHRAKIKRDGIHPSPHLLVFLLLVAVALFSNWR